MKFKRSESGQDGVGEGQPIFESHGSLFDITHLRDFDRDDHIHAIRKRCKGVYVGNDTVLCRALGRYKLFVAGSDVGFGANVILDGYWEIEITEFVARNVRRGMTVFDVGANVGYYSLLLADLVGTAGKVIAIEPNPKSVRLLRNSLSLNGFLDRVGVVPLAVWDSSNEQLILKIPTSEPKNAHIVPNEVMSDSFVNHTVGSVTLDDLAREPVDFIKIDVEGSEERLWRGMQQLINRSPNLVMLLEFAHPRCERPAELLTNISSLFPLRFLDKGGRVRTATIPEIMTQTQDWTLVLSTSESLL